MTIQDRDQIINSPIFYDNFTETIENVSFNMIYIEGGTFSMGNNNGFKDEKPLHNVTLNSFYIAETQVTQELWQLIMGSNPSFFSGNNLPVEQVSWTECDVFIDKINELTDKNFRLPTEAEWEYVAIGGEKIKGLSPTIYAGSNTIDDVSWYKLNSEGRTHPVKSKNPNQLGIYGMSGNVSVWCADGYCSYNHNDQINPVGKINNTGRITRGGSWNSDESHCRNTYRGFADSTNGREHNQLGLHLVLS